MRLSPFSPYLPRYPGPHSVGTIELEVSVPGSLQRSFGETGVRTLLVRLFYPTGQRSGRRPRWTGSGNYTMRGYARFLGLREGLLRAASYLGLKWTEIPALSDAPLADPSTAATWPCMLFSHGLGGTRNAYSQISGSIASDGVVVMAIEHRDSSAAISVVRPDGEEGGRGEEEVVEYVSIRDATAANIERRRHQMAQRAYEVRLGLELLRCLNDPHAPSIFPSLRGGDDHDDRTTAPLASFAARLDAGHGRVLVGGHSFGAATAVNCAKDTTTRLPSDGPDFELKASFRALVLLDVWTEVLADSAAVPLALPTLSIASQAFQRWSGNWTAVTRLMKANKRADASLSVWVRGSAHLSQSDFGLLFPTATRYAFKAEIDPHRAMDLNVRAVREFLRRCGLLGPEQPVDEDIFSGREQELVVESLT
ncbi:Putative uncharacterized protein [Taphrina deformans PYCC 5710]|uniref:Putative phospholipase n=1 Tax=Taphrina deformans (strain PYCC 5710 / ATCC 11124 / CBS 356.35 / IMI 108563 / JCM 9778 / NBRC 8474) TaxID=1097556 RepID=R4XCS9_TAPDE|nr:Putative uncharacterized protein [Taphrina deformans PYCC 5710]|eukprot:CCG83428.1 Putative uncharacterized protein [Taphrina deformans PYCC 5710]